MAHTLGSLLMRVVASMARISKSVAFVQRVLRSGSTERDHHQLPTSFCAQVHTDTAVPYKQMFAVDMPKLGQIQKRDAAKLQQASGLLHQATTAEIVCHTLTKKHAPGLDLGPSAYHAT